MAATIIPLVASMAPDIIALIASLVHRAAPAAEQKYGSGTGPVKFADVFAAVIDAMNKAAGAGAIPKSLPPDDAIKSIIQAVLTSLKLTGALDSQALPVASTPQAITVVSGQTITITVQ
jgi:hypothetical protein